MRKSIFFGEIHHWEGIREGEYDAAFARLLALDIHGFQFSDREIAREGEMPLLEAMRRHDMTADVIHTVIPLLSADNTVFDDACRRACETLDLLDRFECKRLMIVAPCDDVAGEQDRERAMSRMIEGLSRIIPVARERGIDVYIENFSIPLLPYSTISDIERITDALPEVKYTFDVGNFLCVGEDPFAAYARLRSRVSMFHLKNFTPTEGAEGFLCTDGRRLRGVAFDEGAFDMLAFLRGATTEGGDILPVIEHNARLPADDLRRSVTAVDALLR